jgi:hypothetical protein
MLRKNLVPFLAAAFILATFSNVALAQYKLTNLDSNQVRGAKNDDPLAVNGWGMAPCSRQSLVGVGSRFRMVHAL